MDAPNPASASASIGPFAGLPETSLCLLVDDLASPRRVLLGLKKRGLGEGKIVGVGGHVEPGESHVEAVAREVGEEICVDLPHDALHQRARLEFEFPHRPEWRMASTVFMAALPAGAQPRETAEIAPRWFDLRCLPLDRMWDDNRVWLGRVLGGERLNAWFIFGADNQTVQQRHVQSLGAAH
ncbi:8-oxo-dGTP diphosphatase [Micrococcales bacterium 31B]|nr:8-oxo-dGTP diphosphatase [Micrococcales bacterium 31B]